MSSYVGDFALESTFDVKFTSRRFSTGAPFALASGVISAYVDNSTTQLTAGITLTADFDTVTGLNNVRVVATAANGYAAGSNYQLVITTGTVDSVSVVGEVIGQFSIQARSALRPATAGRTLVVDAAGLSDANMVKAGPTGSGTAQTAKDIGGAVPAAAAGASGGLLISGSNSGTTTFGALSVTGSLTVNGKSEFLKGVFMSGDVSTQTSGLKISGVSGDYAMDLRGEGAGGAIYAQAGATGHGVFITGGSTSGNGIHVVTISGHGINLAPVGTNMHGILATGGNGGTSDGIKAVAGTGGVPIRGDITGNLTGNVSGSVGSVTGAVGSVTGAVGSVTGLTAATVHSDLDDIQSRLPAALTAGGNIKADTLAISGSTESADRLERSTLAIVTGTVGSGSTTTSLVASALSPTSGVNDQFNGRIISFSKDTTTAALRGQSTDITDYVHATLTFTVTALTTAAVSGDDFVIT